MRIIAGELRGRVLKSTTSSMLRPTTDRVRESIFNILANRIPLEGALVLDLFAGTGALGIEALSRGAAYCEFVESDRRVAALIADNLKALGLTARASVHVRDVMKYVAGLERSFNLILADPPYAATIFDRLVHDIFSSGCLAPGGIFVLEHGPATAIAPPPGAGLLVQRTFGDTAITLLGPGPADPSHSVSP
ncbi:MAG: 16S rRNA (guanine(966)-N(2))-methyltransferase RsmD [Bacteroidetes bacterium]|nr:16S rRNA (guanine(966)-N(2))-methyltransferase RsmD [Bacteroidota bacterium]